MTDTRDAFWTRLEKINAGMLGVSADARLVPMSHYASQSERALWFITAHGTDLVTAVSDSAQPATYVVASGNDGLYAHLTGTLSLSTDAAKLDEIWNVVASSWFEGGKRDPDLRLLKFALSAGDIWVTDTSSLAFLYKIAQSKVTHEKPDMGVYATLAF